MAQREFDQVFTHRRYQIIVDAPPPSPDTLKTTRTTPVRSRVVHYMIDGMEHLENEWDRQLAVDKQAHLRQAD